MKAKNITLFQVIGILILGLAAFAEEGPKIKKYDELVTVSAEIQTVKVQADCVSDPQGFLYLPGRGKLTVKEITIKGAELKTPKVEDGKLNDLPYLRLQIDKPNTPVTVTLVYEGKDIVKEKDSKLGETYPGRVTNYTRTFSNTTPLDIGKYSLTLQLPPGKEVFKVTKPAKFEDIRLSVKDGRKTIAPKATSVKAGATYELVLDVCEEPGSRSIAIWVISGGLAIFFLIKRRGILTKAGNTSNP